MRQILFAIAFLSRIPVPASIHTDVSHAGKSARWFPLVGLLLGLLYAATAWLLTPKLPALVVAVLVLVLDAFATGALHLDGLADMADGLGGGRTREDVLRIMRDHAIGSYGATALVLLLLLKAACLSELLVSTRGLWTVVVAPALSRWAIVLLSLSAGYARRTASADEIGSGALAQTMGRTEFIIASVTCAPLPLLFGIKATLACWATVALATVLMARICRRRIGGFTGDTLGANVVISEALQFIVALLLIRI
jgi:cobalamin 5'-phosphate synthase/cobalamin synthase